MSRVHCFCPANLNFLIKLICRRSWCKSTRVWAAPRHSLTWSARWTAAHLIRHCYGKFTHQRTLRVIKAAMTTPQYQSCGGTTARTDTSPLSRLDVFKRPPDPETLAKVSPVVGLTSRLFVVVQLLTSAIRLQSQNLSLVRRKPAIIGLREMRLYPGPPGGVR